MAPEAPKAAAPKADKKREEVFSKDQFVDTFAAALNDNLGLKVSKVKAWDIYKTAMNAAFKLASTKPLSLSGIGRFSILSSKRSEKANKPALRMRFRASSRVNEVLNAHGDFLVAVPAEAPAAPAAAKGKAEL